MTKEHYDLMVERLREQVMEDPQAKAYVDQYATKCLEHLDATLGVFVEPKIWDELFCQYQNQAWNKLFKDLMP